MLQVGIFNAYFPYTLEESATRIREHGFNTVQLDLETGFARMENSGLLDEDRNVHEGGKAMIQRWME